MGYGSILPQHTSDHSIRHLTTTQATDYQYHGEWTPSAEIEQEVRE